jgi:hypothetical protein
MTKVEQSRKSQSWLTYNFDLRSRQVAQQATRELMQWIRALVRRGEIAKVSRPFANQSSLLCAS